MIIIRLYGGFGNQLFQLSCFLKLKKHSNIDVKLDASFFEDQNTIYSRIRRALFKTPIRNIYFNSYLNEYILDKNSLLEILCQGNKLYKYYYKVLNYLIPLSKIPNITSRKIINDIDFDNLNFKNNVIYILDSYCQELKYINNTKNELLNLLDEFYLQKINIDKHICTIDYESDIIIHVRKGDMYSKFSKKIYADINIDYYKKAIDVFKKSNNIKKIFICTDDLVWCENNFTEDKFGHEIILVTNTNLFQDFKLMLKAKNIILSNSTFAWWAAYLVNKNNVIMPKYWYNNSKSQFIKPTERVIEI